MGELGPDVPLHFTRFHPDYQLLNLPPTPVATLERARAMAMDRGLRYVYVGNVPGHAGNHTYCPGCRAPVITRQDFFVLESNLKDGRCGACGRAIAGVWA
jgi:pyruvate formate lyase activating enzyme